MLEKKFSSFSLDGGSQLMVQRLKSELVSKSMRFDFEYFIDLKAEFVAVHVRAHYAVLVNLHFVETC